jgi:uncharacterized membrane protein
MLRSLVQFIRTTLVGGVVFLIPFLVITLLIGQALDILARLARPLGRVAPRWVDYGETTQITIAAAGLLVLAFLSGVFARTRPGQALVDWVESSVLGALPQFSFARGVAESLEAGDEKGRVVLVPSDAGLSLGFLFEEPVEGLYPVFLPDAPQWTAGSVIFVEEAKLHPIDMTMLEATRLLKRLGAEERPLLERIARRRR